jgi:hypothetical protein
VAGGATTAGGFGVGVGATVGSKAGTDVVGGTGNKFRDDSLVVGAITIAAAASPSTL